MTAVRLSSLLADSPLLLETVQIAFYGHMQSAHLSQRRVWRRILFIATEPKAADQLG